MVRTNRTAFLTTLMSRSYDSTRLMPQTLMVRAVVGGEGLEPPTSSV